MSKKNMAQGLFIALSLFMLSFVLISMKNETTVKAGESALGTRKYDDYQAPKFCGTSCHTDFYQQWRQAMM